jgi:hypothetical protein
MRVRWLRAALRNLQEEASFIAAEDPKAARWWFSGSSQPSRCWPSSPESAGPAASPTHANWS